MPEVCGHWVLESAPRLVCALSRETSGGPVCGAACGPWPWVSRSRGQAQGGRPEQRRSLGSCSCPLTRALLAGAEARTVLPKKEKLKLRRERWLQSKLPRPAPVAPCPGLAQNPASGWSGPGGGGLRHDRQMAPWRWGGPVTRASVCTAFPHSPPGASPPLVGRTSQRECLRVR